MLVYDRAVSLDAPAYFVVLDFDGGRDGVRYPLRRLTLDAVKGV